MYTKIHLLALTGKQARSLFTPFSFVTHTHRLTAYIDSTHILYQLSTIAGSKRLLNSIYVSQTHYEYFFFDFRALMNFCFKTFCSGSHKSTGFLSMHSA